MRAISSLNERDDDVEPFCEQQYTHGSCHIFLFKFTSFGQSDPPRIASNFRHLLSCGTIDENTQFDRTTGVIRVKDDLSGRCQKLFQDFLEEFKVDNELKCFG